MGGARSTERLAGVDLARALAALIMVQGHATHGWIAPESQGPAYAVSRLLGTFPLPAFLLLAGTSVMLRYAKALRRNEPLSALARRLRRRGLTLIAVGYGFSGAMALIDGGGLPSALRADVLQVIGLSIALASLLLAPRPAAFVARCASLGAVAMVVCPLLPVFDLPFVAAAFVGPFVDAPPLTRMPLIPLFAWFAMGIAVGHWLDLRAARGQRALALPLAGLAVLLTLGGQWATEWSLAGAPLSRQHPAVLFNVLDLAGRALAILAAGLFLHRHAGPHLQRIGLGSLTIYLAHLPFCYGLFASPFRHRVTMLQAVPLILGLAAFSYGVLRFQELQQKARRAPIA
ncbi:MAG: heparan-alpha-glucosaminide N-acetyltransferase domain-containing protein [Myxococcota bacterium]